MPRRVPRKFVALVLVAVAALTVWVVAWATFPKDTTPEGAYLRVVKGVNLGQPAELFAYIEEEAQHAAYTVGKYRRQSLELARKAYPPEPLAELEDNWGAVARAGEGPRVFAWYAKSEGWLDQLRKDLSGVQKVEISGERASVQTAQGTRYAFRRRPNGIWGLTAFSPFLIAEAERAARDHSMVERAAEDYRRAASEPGAPGK